MPNVSLKCFAHLVAALAVVLALLGTEGAAGELADTLAKLDRSVDTADDYVTRVGIGHNAGSGVGYSEGFTTLEGLVPLIEDPERSLFFADLRMLLNNQATLGANLGLGHRVFDDDLGRTLGLFAWYDFRNTGNHEFHQLTLGFETLGEYLDFRSNVYIPNVSDRQKGLDNRFGAGHQLFVDRTEIAMTGIDTEVGGSLLTLGRLRTRAFGGGYYFTSPESDGIWGWRARAEIGLTDNIDLSVSVQEDDLFGTTVNIGAIFRYLQPLRRPGPGPEYPPVRSFRRPGDPVAHREVRQRLADPVPRFRNIVVHTDETIALASAGGSAINMLHISPSGTGDGSFASPYGTIAEALADPLANSSVIYASRGGTFTENVVLGTDTTILSNGPTQQITTQFGLQTLPLSGSSPTALPQIVGDVTLADDSTLSGFQITGTVSGNGISNAVFTESRVQNAPGSAISLVASQATLSNLTITDAGVAGIHLSDSDATVTDVTITGDATTAGTDGVLVDTDATSRTITLENLSVSDVTDAGVELNVNGTGTLTATISGTTTLAAAGNALDAETTTGSTGDLLLSVSSTSASSSGAAGIQLDGSAGGGTLTVTGFADNSVTAAATGGILADTVTFDSDASTAAIESVDVDNLTISATGDGLQLLSPSGELDLGTLSITNSNGTGLEIDTQPASTEFLLSSEGGSIATTGGPAISLDDLEIDMSLDSVSSTDSPTTGITLDTVGGSLAIGTTTITGSTGTAIVVQNSLALAPRFVVLPHHTDPGHEGEHYMSQLIDGHHFAWLDQDTSTPDTVDVFYDFRSLSGFANEITADQITMAELALEKWEDATNGRLQFTQNTTASVADIIIIGTGDLAAVGETSEEGGVVGLGGGVFAHSPDHPISNGFAWQDSAETWDTEFGNGDPAGTTDYFSIAAHEIGHALGLNHTSDSTDIMDGGAYIGELTTFSAVDIEHIQSLYGEGTNPPPASTNAGLAVNFGTTTIERTQTAVPAADAINATTNNDGNALLIFNNLTITNGNGNGLVADNTGTININTLAAAGSAISVTDGAALDITDTTVDITLDAITADGGTSAILLDNVDGSLAVTGVGTGGGGGTTATPSTISDMTGTGIVISDSTASVSLNLFTITNDTGVATGLLLDDSGSPGTPDPSLTLTNSTLTGTADNWTGISVNLTNDGTISISDTLFTGTTGSGQVGMTLVVDGGGTDTPTAALAFDDNTISLGGVTPLAISLSASNGGLLNPLSGLGNLATNGTIDLTGSELFNANGTDASISGSLEVNSATVFP